MLPSPFQDKPFLSRETRLLPLGWGIGSQAEPQTDLKRGLASGASGDVRLLLRSKAAWIAMLVQGREGCCAFGRAGEDGQFYVKRNYQFRIPNHSSAPGYFEPFEKAVLDAAYLRLGHAAKKL